MDLRSLPEEEVETLTCRTCGVGLTEPGGCDFCKDFKTRQIAIRGQLQNEEPVDMIECADEILRLVRHQANLLRLQIRASKSYDPALTRELKNVGETAAKVLDATRKLYEAGDDVLQAMSLTERMALFQEWFGGLPTEVQRKVFSRLSVQVARLSPGQDPQ